MNEINTPEKEQVEKVWSSKELEQCIKATLKFSAKDEESKGSHLPYVKDSSISKKEQRAYDAVARQMNPAYDYNKGMIMAMAIVSTKEEKAEKARIKKEKNTHVALTEKEIASITKETKTKFDLIFTLPPPPWEIIIPAMSLSKMKPAELCTYVADKFPRIAAVTAFAAAVPDIGISTGIYALLSPLTGIAKPNAAQKLSIETYTTQLRNNFTATVGSIASICNGNLMMFALTGIATKRKGVPYNTKLAAPVFTIQTNKGAGTIYISCKKDIHARGYIVYYGKGVYDKATWTAVPCTSRVLIEGLIPKDDLNFIMVAVGKGKLGEGFWSDPQGKTVPSN